MPMHESTNIDELTTEIENLVPAQFFRMPSYALELSRRWSERQRAWHGPAHLLDLLRRISAEAEGTDRDVLMVAALYHDAIYSPKAADNEDASAALLLRHAADSQSPVIACAAEIIAESKWSSAPSLPLGRRFFELDTRQLGDSCPLSERLAYEMAIFREYQFASWAEYRTKRAAFLRQWAERFPEHRKGAFECIELLHGLRPRIAVYPGSFNPFHRGHLSILRQAERSFDKVVISVGINRRKSTTAESARARFTDLQGRLCFHEVTVFDGLLSSYLDRLGYETTIVRGVRDGTDLEAELRYVRFLNELRPGTNVVWIACEAELQHLSSSAVRELESFEPGAGERYLPDAATIYDLVQVE
jgi:pantetheine-phosphate adenylyltransferase